MEGNPLEEIKERVDGSILITEIPVIEEGGVVPMTREGLAQLVEAPLLEACEELYDKNIRTEMSSANGKDVGGEGYITIAFDSLSEENKGVALSFGQPDSRQGENYVKIIFPITPTTTVGDIRRISLEAVSKFHKQTLTWGRYTLEELASMGMSPEDVPKEWGFDPETSYFYQSNELLHKAKDL